MLGVGYYENLGESRNTGLPLHVGVLVEPPYLMHFLTALQPA